MKEYFTLQLKILNRQLTDWGVIPVFGYLIAIAVFIGLSTTLFEKTQYAEYAYILLALSIVTKLAEVSRNEFLKLWYSKSEYFKLRIIENFIIATPFIFFLIFKEKYMSSFLLLIATGLSTLINFNKKPNFVLPTPFSTNPFEFTVGFRINYFLYLFAYFLAFMSISVNNFNLGLFSLIVALLGCLSYYVKSEREFYVWIFSLSPKEFLLYKLKNIIQYSTLLCLPIIVSLSLCFYTKIDIILGFQCLGYLFIFTTMLAKYSVFPEKLNMRFTVVFAFIVWLPPLLIVIIPYLYIQSTKKLKEILT
ncbi:ABC transporter permease [Flavobacterium sp. W22_SRS_FP1]|uniref:ABC transporter permease n=1 Tax=Flavobacterium sp. W22_SRS_FP1 TaxID=3240276 RepID=UPI003F90FA2E